MIDEQVAGSFVGALADNYGRKKMCIMYAVFYAISCLVKLVNNYYILMVRAHTLRRMTGTDSGHSSLTLFPPLPF